MRKTKAKSANKRRPRARITRAISSSGAMKSTNVTLMNTKPKKAHRFSRSRIRFDTIVNPLTTGDIQRVYTFQLTDVDGYTDFVNLFDKYKIEKIKLTFQALDISSPGNLNRTFYIFKNNNSTLTAGTLTEAYVSQQQNVWAVNFSEDNKVFTKTIYPYWISDAFSSIGNDFVQNQSKSSGWIDTAYSDIVHYGLCVYVPQVEGNVLTYLSVQLDAEFTMVFKDAT